MGTPPGAAASIIQKVRLVFHPVAGAHGPREVLTGLRLLHPQALGWQTDAGCVSSAHPWEEFPASPAAQS